MLFLILLLLFGISQVCHADVYVVTNAQGNIYDVSNEPDCVIPVGDTRTIIKGQNISNLPISGNPQLYTFNKGGFTLNASAITKQQTAQQQAIAQETSDAQAKASAIAKLTDAISKVNPADVLTNQELNAILPS